MRDWSDSGGVVESPSLAAVSPRNLGREEARSRRPAAGESGSHPFGPRLSGGNSGKLSTPQRLSSRAQRPAAALVRRHRTHRQISAILTGGPEGGDESRPQSTSCRFYAATLMNAGFPVWTSRGEPAVGPEIRRSRATETMTNDTSEYDAGHSCGPSFALGGPCPLGCYP